MDIASFDPLIVLAYGSSTNYGGVVCANAQVGGSNANTIFVTGDQNNQSAVTAVAPNGGELAYVSDGCILKFEWMAFGNQGTAVDGLRTGQRGIGEAQNVICDASWTGTGAPCIATDKEGVTNLGGTTLTVKGCGSAVIQLNGGTYNAASPQPPFGKGNIAIPSAIACSGATVVATGPARLMNFNSSTFTGSGVAGTTGVRAILKGPVWLDGGGSGCNSIFPGNSPCQITQGAQDDANDPATSPIVQAQFTIGGLPTCNSAVQGTLAYVTNGVASPTYRASVSATGSTLQLVGCDGSGWTYH